MNQDQITGILRVVVPVICTALAAQGFSLFGNAAVVAQITTAAIALGAIGWAWYAHTNAAKLAAAASVDPNVRVLVPTSVIGTDDKVAALVANTNVPNVVKLTPGL